MQHARKEEKDGQKVWKEKNIIEWESHIDVSRTILDLLKEPVSLGIQGSNNNRGHQR